MNDLIDVIKKTKNFLDAIQEYEIFSLTGSTIFQDLKCHVESILKEDEILKLGQHART